MVNSIPTIRISSPISYMLMTFVLLLAVRGLAIAQNEVGRPYIKTFTGEDYSALPLNTDILQTPDGVLYFANGEGVLSFDAQRWNLMKLPENKAAKSLSQADDGTIYVGSVGEFGYLIYDSSSTQHYHSLSHRLSDEDKKFRTVHKTYCIGNNAYFLTDRKIFIWDGDSLTSWAPEKSLLRNPGFIINNELLVNERDAGIKKLVDGAFVPIPGGDYIANERIYAMVPMEENEIMIATRLNGLFVYDGVQINPFYTEIDSFLKENIIVSGIRVGKDMYALGTLKAGIVVLSLTGELQFLIDKEAGLPDNEVSALLLDAQDGLWAATDGGLSRIELMLPAAQFPISEESMGVVNDVKRHKGKLYVATSNGLYYLSNFDRDELKNPSFNMQSKFVKLENFEADCRSILSINGHLFVAAASGVYKVYSESVGMIYEGYVNELKYIDKWPKTFLAGTAAGLVVFRQEGPSWVPYPAEWISNNVTSFITTQDHLWLSTAYNGLVRVNISNSIDDPYDVERFSADSNGLPSDIDLHLFKIGNSVVVTSEEGLYEPGKNSDNFVKRPLFGDRFEEEPRVVKNIVAADDSTYYVATNLDRGRLDVKKGGSIVWEDIHFQLFADQSYKVTYIEEQDDNARYLWYGGNKGLVRIDINRSNDLRKGFKAILTEVFVKNEPTYHGGYGAIAGSTKAQAPLDFTDNSIRFEYGAANFSYFKGTEFQYMLVGYDKGWSEWNTENKKDYTNLDAGEYQFKVRARNQFGQISEEASYQFTIATPWYQTWWAITLFAIALTISIYLIVMIRSQRLKAEKRKLESLVDDRTKELRDSQDRMAEQQKLASLGQLTAGIAHEIKNPLNFVNNFAELSEELIEELEEVMDEQKEKVEEDDLEDINDILDNLKKNVTKINEHGKRADEIVKRMLMHSRGGQGEKEAVQLNDMLEENLNLAYRGLRGKNSAIVVSFDKHLDEKVTTANVIRQDIGQVLLNICNNAIYAAYKKKGVGNGNFEPTVTISTKAVDKYVRLSIKDNGVGISNENREKIFNPFFTTKPTGEGTGLGLSISHDIIVKGHGGQLSVNSEEGVFTEFIIDLPLN